MSRALNSAFSLSSSVTTKSHEQIDKAIKDSGNQQIKVGEFKLTKQQEFQKAAKTASEGVSKMSKYAGYLGTGIVMGLGMTNPLTAGLVVGGMTAGGGMLGKKTGKSGEAIKELEGSKWFQGDRDEVLKNIDKSLVTATVTNAVLAGASASGAGKAATTATTKAGEEVVKEGGETVVAEAAKTSAKDKLKKGGLKIGSGGKNVRLDPETLKMTGSTPSQAGILQQGSQGYAETALEKVAVPDMTNIGTGPSNIFGKLKKTGGEVGEFLTTKPQAQDYKQLSLSNLFTQDKGLRSQFGRDFVGNLKAGAAQFIPGENTAIDMIKGGGTLNDWILGEEA